MVISDAAAPPRRRPAPRPRPAPSAPFAEARRLLNAAAMARACAEPEADERLAPLQGRLSLPPRTVDLAVDATIREVTHTLLTHGWTPVELHAFAAKRLDADAVSYLLDAVAAVAQWSGHQPWLAELDDLQARVWWTSGQPHLLQWSARHGRRRPDALAVVVEVLALLAHLPHTDEALAGTPTAPQLVAGALVHDARIVGRIDALLSRAGGSNYPDEASACAGKAQELMLRYATVPASARLLARGTRLDPRRIAASVAAELAGLAGLARRARTGFPVRPKARAIESGRV
jgi:hypothetical protein